MIYALIPKKFPIKNIAASLPKSSLLSLSKKVVVFKSKKRPKFEGKLVKIFQEYELPKYLRLEEIKEGIFEKAPGSEEIKALILDEIFEKKRIKKKRFNLAFYDFDYIQQDFIDRLGKRIEKELKEKGIKTRYVKREGDLEIVLIKKTSPPLLIYLGKTIKIE